MKSSASKYILHFLIVFLIGTISLPLTLKAQTDGGEKPKKEKAEKPAKEKKEKPPKEKKEKPAKEKKEEPAKEKKEEPAKDDKAKEPKEKKEKKSKGDDDFSDELKGAGLTIPLDSTASDEEVPKDLIGGVDDTSRVSVSCYRYRYGYMEFVDKNYAGIKIKRTKKKEIHTNTNDGNKLVFKIQWESDFAYKLVFVKAKLPSRFKKGYSMTCKMQECWDEYYDCDCALNGIVQYASILKTLSPKELKAKQREEEKKLKEEEDAAAQAAKKAAGGDAEGEKGDAKPDAKGDDDKPEKNNGKVSGVKPEPAKNNGKVSGMKPEPAKGKEKKAKKEKKPKEKKEKKEKAPKEKKEKEPKEKKEKES